MFAPMIARTSAGTAASPLQPGPRRSTLARPSHNPAPGGTHDRGAAQAQAAQDFSAVRPSSAPTRLGSFPHAEAIGNRLGGPLSLSATVDSAACHARGTTAFTRDGQVHFADANPPLRVAAHEAAHALQQSGATRDQGLGAERHADAVASAVTQGRDARPLLGAHGAPVAPGTYHYTEIDTAAQSATEWDAQMPLRVSEDGLMAVGEDATQHSFWADPAKIAESNKTLESIKSVIRLKEQSEKLSGTAPGGKGARTLTKVLPQNNANSSSGEHMKIWADCGKSGRDVMGAGEGFGQNYDKMAAVYNIPIKLPDAPVWYKPWGWHAKPEGPDKETDASSPKEMKKEILKEKLGAASGDAALAQYEAKSEADRERVDKEAGINKYAAPKTGEGYTMASGGAPAPGASSTWNFHWAGVVMAIGGDRVTLENYSVSDAKVMNDKWQFQMYGSARKAGQTFYEQHKDTGQHGQVPVAMRVHKRDS